MQIYTKILATPKKLSPSLRRVFSDSGRRWVGVESELIRSWCLVSASYILIKQIKRTYPIGYVRFERCNRLISNWRLRPLFDDEFLHRVEAVRNDAHEVLSGA